MDKLDYHILDALQNDFPLCERPFKVMGERLQCSEQTIWKRVQGMIQSGVVRRLGVSLDSRKLGYASTLAAVSVASNNVSRAADVINRYQEVTHCYLRKDTFNIWFTLIGASSQRIQEILSEISETLDLAPSHVLNVPVERLFKLDARFDTPKSECDT